MTLPVLTFLGLATTAFAEDFEYWSGTRCIETIVSSGTLACDANTVPISPIIRGINLKFANGLRAEFYDSSALLGTPWFTDDGNGGCVTDSAARTNCIYVPC